MPDPVKIDFYIVVHHLPPSISSVTETQEKLHWKVTL